MGLLRYNNTKKILIKHKETRMEKINTDWKWERLKGLGHAILGNFSTDQMVIELTKIRE